MNYSYKSFVDYHQKFFNKVKVINPNFNENIFKGNNDVFLLTDKKLYVFSERNLSIFDWVIMFLFFPIGLLVLVIKKNKVSEFDLNSLDKIKNKNKNHILEFVDTIKNKEKEDEQNLKIKKENERIENENNLKEIEKTRTRKEKEKKILEEKRKNLIKVKNNKLISIDKDNNGIPDIVQENIFENLILKNQIKISEIEKSYSNEFSLKFVQLSNFLKLKKELIIKTFKVFSNLESYEELYEFENQFEKYITQIICYYKLEISAIAMTTSLLENKKIEFNMFHEVFDKMNVFDSNYQVMMKQNLLKINSNLSQVINSIHSLETELIFSLDSLSGSIENMNENIDSQLSKINSSVKVGNLINSINTYQNYKTNKKLDS
tara:strand:+ start:27 stop:1154 length:1128 start_codon:yes stop_codon:yes gene_type:complete